MFSDAVGSVLEEAVDDGRAVVQEADGTEPMTVDQVSNCAMMASNLLSMDDAVVRGAVYRLSQHCRSTLLLHTHATIVQCLHRCKTASRTTATPT